MIEIVINVNKKPMKFFILCDIFYNPPVMNIEFRAGIGARAASRYGSGSTIMIRLRLRNTDFKLENYKLIFMCTSKEQANYCDLK
jgi:hypothetical protein